MTLKAFPSPFDNFLEVQVTSNEEQGSVIVLYNAQGRIIRSQANTLKRGINTISLTELDLASGIYFLKVTTADQQQVLKLVSE
ncbi:T9SS type A sorting domain-containing protein [uncultured Pontibacter sp.]|uniref:T9SS type A sorting domain-containing protein n=1 Tax=uncultured Pontibacter sp. TaxID=453356 RepID=UPI002618FC10|nr:T9SS type A sorting domain-containing protein [uncultured Pontibacter sp.]